MTLDLRPRTVFFGTPEFALASLAAVLEAGFEVPLVVTRPDRPVGRRAEPRPSAVGAFAAAHGLRVEKPDRLRGNADLAARLSEARPDALAVVAYGRILPPEILALPRLACVNVHASLLPRHRGASPVQAAILAGDPETGVTTMRMEEGLDTGPVYLERRVAIGAGETAGELSHRLAELGGELLVATLAGLEAGTLAARPQTGEATFCRPIRREDGAIDWSLGAGELVRRLRAFTPWPGLFTFLDGERVKVLAAREGPGGESGEPGSFRLDGGSLVVRAAGGTSLVLERLQKAGRKPVTGAELARSAGPSGRFQDPR
ncbi:MAG TPA: methionyl-tRNA formyltransferase [Thermoanaerobaculia bacterium]|nr:methionyl-tRNA formyltransferase [Thermoanaerobaculia bacterium]